MDIYQLVFQLVFPFILLDYLFIYLYVSIALSSYLIIIISKSIIVFPGAVTEKMAQENNHLNIVGMVSHVFLRICCSIIIYELSFHVDWNFQSI